jgi:hypothetical protein
MQKMALLYFSIYIFYKDSGARLASYLMCIGGSFPGGKAAGA